MLAPDNSKYPLCRLGLFAFGGSKNKKQGKAPRALLQAQAKIKERKK